MIQEWVGAGGLALLLGLVLGYCSALPRVKRLERELAALSQSKSLAQKVQMYQVLVKKLESELVRAEAQDLVLQSALDSAQVRVQDSELELVRLKQSQSLKETELAMELEKVRAQVWVQRE
jgi:SMC interacting uncharacterized protein involved in chromosome segregation